MVSKPTILVIGTADTKSEEMQYLENRINALDVNAVTMDVGVLEPASFPVAYSHEDVANHADTTMTKIPL